MLPALFLIPLVALFRIWLAWQPAPGADSWAMGASPLAAVALCAGLYLPRRLALVIPLGILLCSDAIIDAHWGAHFFSLGTCTNYTLLAVIGLGGISLRQRGAGLPGWLAVLGLTGGAATFFYGASNALAWLGSRQYPQTLAGLWQALTTGLPGYPPTYLFFRNELVSDALYSMVFVACVRLTAPARVEPVSVRSVVA